jgi:arylsulfatase A-like enzyme
MKTKSGILAGLTASAAFLQFFSCSEKPHEKPNILWIVSEDNTILLNCYGDTFATTPNLDKLASQGILNRNAFVTFGVCAPSRSTIITGMYPPCTGTQNMRSNFSLPPHLRFYTEYLREQGYYCVNRAKEDYNTPKPEGAWDESGSKADYHNRMEGQPFFQVINLQISHESNIHKWSDSLVHDPAKVKLPPYHPDIPEFRHDWAQYYDKVTEMDRQAGEILDQLEKEGLAENTIVFYYADNGGVLGRSKRFVYDSGIHIPLIVRIPKKFRYLAAEKPGTRTDRLVSLVDLAPTMLNITGIKIPDYMQGFAFLGPDQKPPREYIYAFRDRMDEKYDMVRAVRDKEFKYIRNYMPHRISGQYLEYLWLAPSMRAWEKAYREGKCNEAQSAFWEPRQPEELYNTVSDPYEVRNLAGDPSFEQVLVRMRRIHTDWMLANYDTGLIPEAMMIENAGTMPPYEFIRQSSVPYEKIFRTASLASSAGEHNLQELVSLLSDPYPAVRYWAATGCLILGTRALPARDALLAALKDSSVNVRIVTAEILYGLGEKKAALKILSEALSHPVKMARVTAFGALDQIGDDAEALVPVLEKLYQGRINDQPTTEYDVRCARTLIQKYKKQK